VIDPVLVSIGVGVLLAAFLVGMTCGIFVCMWKGEP